MQQVIETVSLAAPLNSFLKQTRAKRVLLVCGRSFDAFPERKELESLPVQLRRFSSFSPNPLYESVLEGVRVFQEGNCDAIVAIGGGSAMDVAKCIKLFSGMRGLGSCLRQPFQDTGIPLAAVPATAGTGSESTSFAVIYAGGEKQSVAHASLLPQYVLLVPSLLDTLPDYQRKATLLDAFCHAVESVWSVHATKQSRQLACQAIEWITRMTMPYLHRDPKANLPMLRAANLAGQAINLTQTTAAHAMSYQLTTCYHMAHGQAVALCLTQVWKHMLLNCDAAGSPGLRDWLWSGLQQIAQAMDADSEFSAYQNFCSFLSQMNLPAPAFVPEQEIERLAKAVNPTRLGNYPLELGERAIREMYAGLFHAEGH